MKLHMHIQPKNGFLYINENEKSNKKYNDEVIYWNVKKFQNFMFKFGKF